MQYRIIRVPVTDPGSAEEELNAFLRSNRIVSVRSELITTTGAEAWCFLVEYVSGSANRDGGRGRSERIDYRLELSTEEFAIYARLREKRKEIAEEHGIPVYAVLTNEQLASIARRPPATIADLESIDRIGKSRIEKFGGAILDVVKDTKP